MLQCSCRWWCHTGGRWLVCCWCHSVQITEEMPECTHSVTPTMPEISWSPPTERVHNSQPAGWWWWQPSTAWPRWMWWPSRQNSGLPTISRVTRCWLLPVAGPEAGLLHLVINSWGSDGSHVQLCSFVPTKGGKGVMFIYVLREGWELCSSMY